MSTKAKGSSAETLKQMNRRHAREFKQEVESGHYQGAKTMSTSTTTACDQWRVEKTVPEREASDVVLLLNWEDGIRLPWHRQGLLEQIVTEHNQHTAAQSLAAELAQQAEQRASTLARITGERDELRAILQEILDIVESEGHAGNYVPQVALARAALNPTGEREGGQHAERG